VKEAENNAEELASLKHDLEKKRKEEEAKLKKEQEGMSTPGLGYNVAVSFIGGGNRSTWRKPTTCHKSLTNSIT
jgi:hypothetical protein